MASLTKKVINGRPYYYLRETARVGGRPKVVRQVYLGRAEDIERRLAETAEPKSVVSRSFGAVAAALKLCSEPRSTVSPRWVVVRPVRRRDGRWWGCRGWRSVWVARIGGVVRRWGRVRGQASS